MLLGMLLLIQKGSSAGLDARKRRSLLHRGMADIRNGTAHIGYCSVLSIRHCLRCLPRFGACLHLASSTGPNVKPLQLLEIRHPISILGRMTSRARLFRNPACSHLFCLLVVVTRGISFCHNVGNVQWTTVLALPSPRLDGLLLGRARPPVTCGLSRYGM